MKKPLFDETQMKALGVNMDPETKNPIRKTDNGMKAGDMAISQAPVPLVLNSDGTPLKWRRPDHGDF